MIGDNFLWLQQWYYSNCNGDWEHDKAIHIGTLDNPGWSITINLDDTELEDRKFQQLKIEREINDWIFCQVNDSKFEGRCGPLNLSETLQIFRHWVESCQNNSITHK